ncbi:MAG: hypothetical protein ACRDSJ_12540 [Rubrobacteraceae bacterium]
MQTRDMTDEEIVRLGYQALMEKLGPSGFIRFVNLHNPPEGDYTAMDKPINHMTVEEIYAEAARLDSERRRSR